jgi:hypothetical protein
MCENSSVAAIRRCQLGILLFLGEKKHARNDRRADKPERSETWRGKGGREREANNAEAASKTGCVWAAKYSDV